MDLEETIIGNGTKTPAVGRPADDDTKWKVVRPADGDTKKIQGEWKLVKATYQGEEKNIEELQMSFAFEGSGIIVKLGNVKESG